jgi:signal transduction histidine kinase
MPSLDAISDVTPSPLSQFPDAFTAEREILRLRTAGRLAEAIHLCEIQASQFADSFHLPKVACDLYLQVGRPDKASRWITEMLLRMWVAGGSAFNEFATRFQKIAFRLDPNARRELIDRFLGMINEGQVHQRFIRRCQILLQHATEIPSKTAQSARQLSVPPAKAIPSRNSLVSLTASEPVLSRSGTTLSEESRFVNGIVDSRVLPGRLIAIAQEMAAKRPHELERAISQIPIAVLHQERYKQLFDVLIAFLERRESFADALRLLESHPLVRTPSLIQAGFLRVCRKLGQMERIQSFLEQNPTAIKRSVFNVLYEIVYFYEMQNDLQRAREILERIEKLFPDQQPILSTVRNFYLRFGLFSEASRIDLRLAALREGRRTGRKYRAAVAESQAEVYSDLEHQRQLAALSDLTNGISHELGQPITNIRYTIQLFRRQLEREMKADTVFNVFDTVLRETERMGGLVKRLAPVTSSRRVMEDFDAVVRVKEQVSSQRARIDELGVQVEVNAESSILMRADPVRFDQLISNLLLNALDAVAELVGAHSRHIEIALSQVRGHQLRLSFLDNGPGISPENRRKIFEPFFSTKPPGKGEGLGLFIVWNLLKMQGGSISVDSTYTGGARFIVTLPRESKLPPKALEP